MKSSRREYKRSRDEFEISFSKSHDRKNYCKSNQIYKKQYQKECQGSFCSYKNYHPVEELNPTLESIDKLEGKVYSLNEEFDSKCSDRPRIHSYRSESKGNQNVSASIQLQNDTMTRGLVGMCNIGNTCYLNAALQCLLHSDYIVQFLTQNHLGDHIHKRLPLHGHLAKSIAQLCEDMYLGERKRNAFVNPIEVKKALSERAPDYFEGYEQEDAHELLLILLDSLNEDFSEQAQQPKEVSIELNEDELQKLTAEQQGNYFWKRYKTMNRSFIPEAFCGQFRSTVTCTLCGCEKYCFDPFYDLSLPIPNESLGTALKQKLRNSNRSSCGFSLQECLTNLVDDDNISNSDKTECLHCKRQQEYTKSLRIQRSPKLLIIHLKRFSNTSRKRNTFISFPTEGLDLSHYCTDDEFTERRNHLYDLFAVCHHRGTMNSGHYFASCLDQSSGDWYEYDDASVSKISSKEHLSPSKSAYILFYELRSQI